PPRLVADAMQQLTAFSNLLQTCQTAFFMMNAGQDVTDELLGHVGLPVTIALRLLGRCELCSHPHFREDISCIVGNAPGQLSAGVAIKRATKRIARILRDAREFEGLRVVKRRMP